MTDDNKTRNDPHLQIISSELKKKMDSGEDSLPARLFQIKITICTLYIKYLLALIY